MIVRLEVHQHPEPLSYVQLKRCQVQRGAMMEDVGDPSLFRPMRFSTLEEAVLHAKRATFSYLERKQHKEMPDQIDWRIIEEARYFPCPICQQPLYQKAKLGRFGNKLNLDDWGCPRCKKTITLKTDDLTTEERPPT